MSKELELAVLEFLAAYNRTIFYECGEDQRNDPYFSEDGLPDDTPLDGRNCPITIGMIRKMRRLVDPK